MAVTAQSLLKAFGFGHNALGFDTEAEALADIEGIGDNASGALPAAISSVNVPVRNALKGRAATIEAAIALAYPNNAEARAETLTEIQTLLTESKKKYGVSILNGTVVSTSADWITRSNEFRIAANQDLAKAIELLNGIVERIPAAVAEPTIQHSQTVRVRASWWPSGR